MLSIKDLNDTEITRVVRFKSRLRAAVRAGGWDSMYAFAESAGITKDNLRKYLGEDRLPSIVVLVRMSDALGVSIDWLMGYTAGEIVERARCAAGVAQGSRDAAAADGTQVATKKEVA